MSSPIRSSSAVDDSRVSVDDSRVSVDDSPSSGGQQTEAEYDILEVRKREHKGLLSLFESLDSS